MLRRFCRCVCNALRAALTGFILSRNIPAMPMTCSQVKHKSCGFFISSLQRSQHFSAARNRVITRSTSTAVLREKLQERGFIINLRSVQRDLRALRK